MKAVWAVGLIAAATAFVSLGAIAADPSEYSEAERQLFVRPHLDSVEPPARLHYRYDRTGSLQPAVSDHATLILGRSDGARTAAVEYLSGDRKLELPAEGYADGNPIILHFFEREVRELKRLTGGSVGFYRNRIRKALAGDAKLQETQVSYDGRMVKAVAIRIDPFVNDPARSRFEKFAERYYMMVLSPDVPGEVYQLKAVLPGSAAGADAGQTVQGEVLTFERRDNGQ
ncbi:MAG: hypothetical protein H0T52_00675 [Lautropia sp.]|nr:hypothetical protein [Lautropia sp.]